MPGRSLSGEVGPTVLSVRRYRPCIGVPPGLDKQRITSDRNVSLDKLLLGLVQFISSELVIRL